MIRMNRRFAALIAIVLLSVPAAMAQNDPASGIPLFSTQVGGPYESIDLASSNIFLSLPLRDKNGKIPFSSRMIGNSHAYLVPLSGNTYEWQVASAGVGRLRTNVTTFLGWTLTIPTTCNGQADYYYSAFVVYDANLTPHPLNPNIVIDSGGCLGALPGPSPTIDGSGYTVVFTGRSPSLTYELYDKSGNKFTVNSTGSINTLTDPDLATVVSTTTYNGNNSSTAVTDSLGTTVLTANNTPSTPGQPLTYTYTDANGNTQKYSFSATRYTLVTNFGCTGIPEYGPAPNVYLPTSITTPDGGTYYISYETTPNYSSTKYPPPYVTGRIAKLTLPSGGSISYSYSGGNNGINCNSGVVPTLKVTLNDNNGNSRTWTYVNNNDRYAPGNFTVTETDPAGNQTLHYFFGEYQTAEWRYQGQSTGGYTGALRVTTTCYNGNLNNGLGGCQSPSSASAPTLPIFQTDVYTWAGMAPQSLVETKYDSTYGMVTSVGRWNWGAPIPPTSLNLISTTYTPLGNWNGSGCVAVGNYMNDRVCYKNVNDGSGALQSSETFNYSPQGHLLKHVAGTTTSGINGPTLTSKTSYNSNGTVNIFTDVNNAQTTYHYDGSCNNTVPTSVSEPLSLSRSMTWDCNGGVMKSSTDENNQPTTAAYTDPLWRITSATNQGYPATNYTYPDPNHFESYMNFNGSASTVDTTTQTDGLGRPILVQKKQGQGSSSFDSVQYQYGWTQNTGAFVKQSMPYSGSPSAWTTTQYDALGRVSSVTDGGGGSVTYTYNGNDVLQTSLSPAVQKQLEYDALGRLTSVCEINSGTTAWPAVTCGQFNSTKGYWTTYTYNALGNLKSVTQNALGSATQTRNYYYDALGRLTKEVNPESGTTNYYWDAAAPSCGGGAYATPGDLGAKLDYANVYTCYGYDGLHRLLGFDHANGTPCSTFVYDTATPPNGVTVSNTKGRLINAYTNSACNGRTSLVADKWLGYSPRGEVTDIYSSTPNSAGYYHVAKTYWANGAVETLGGIPGVPTITYGADGEGRTSTVTGGSQNLVTTTSYNPASQVTGVTFGSQDSDTYQYDPKTGRMTQYSFNVNGSSLIGKPAWNSNGTLLTLDITDPFNSANQQNCTYGFDALARVNSVGCGNAWAQTFTYDPFGNITKTGSSSWGCATCYNTSTNHYNNTLSSQITYDNDGNLTYDTFHHYQWDPQGHPIVVDTENLTYDATGNMVELGGGGTPAQYLYDETGGGALADSQAHANAYAQIPLPGGAMANYSGGALSTYLHADWLGSIRFVSTPGRALYSDLARAPYGEEYALSGAPFEPFAGMLQQLQGDLFDTHYREYHPTQGRWLTPEPAGIAAVDLNNPQTWNRYAYALNNPLSYTDPTGLECVWDDGSYDSENDFDTGNSGSCAKAGGTWVDHSYFQQNGLADWSGDPNSDIANYAQNFTTTVTATACPATPTQHGVGIGLQAGGTATAGAYVVGGVVNASAGGGMFYNPKTGPSLGGYLSGVLAGNSGGTSKGLPQQSLQSPRIVGAYAGYGPGVFLTNAGSAQQLSGPFAVLNVDLGIGIGKASVQFSADKNGTWIVTVNGGPAPYSDGLGFDVSGFTTNTAAGGTGCP
jgi:RHS repeat-associated protein